VCLLVFTHILLGILIFKGFTARRLYKPFGIKELIMAFEGYNFSPSGTATLLQGKVAPGTHQIGGWVDLGIGLDIFRNRKSHTSAGT
jgi:hypothetical protein